MFEHFRPSDSLLWTVAWQSSAFLAVGLAAAVACRKRPARAHRALLAAMLAALIAPTLTETGRRLGWGLWKAPDTMTSTKTSQADRPASDLMTIPPPPIRPVSITTTVLPAVASLNRPAPAAFPWRSAFLAAWALASLALAARLAVSFVRGWLLVARGRMVDDPAVKPRVNEAAGRLGLRITPGVRRLSMVQCPAIWCWGREPVLLLPETEKPESSSIDWDGVFCHELAHWSRRDHLSALAGELLASALPWNPLAWWSRSRLADLAELACDDWVIAAGLPAADYAESLLGLAPQSRSTPALAAVSSRRGLVNRIRRVLAEGRREPSPGVRWSVGVCLATLAAVGALALAQARPSSAGPPAPRDEDQAMNKTLSGTVVGPDGKPLAGASVVWLAYRKPPLSFLASPNGEAMKDSPDFLHRTLTDADGAFTFSAPFNPDEFFEEGGESSQVVVVARGYGLATERLTTKQLSDPLTLKIPEQVAIHGRLLAPDGKPASGVTAMLSGFRNDVTHKGMFVGYRDADDKLPEYWPRPQTTDADGRFTIEGAPIGMYVSLIFKHPDYAVDEATVSTIPDGGISPELRAFEIGPVKPTFKQTLKPARPVHGRVTDKSTGEPLAGMLVEMIPMRMHGGGRFTARTDADGRYRISGDYSEGPYFRTVYPDADSGYLAAKDVQQGWSKKAVDFALEKGPLITGRVIDQDSKNPIAGAAVVYQPAPGNTGVSSADDLVLVPTDGMFAITLKDRYDFSNPVVTDADGRFTITGLPGGGFLAVDTASDAYIRTPHRNPRREPPMFPQGFIAIDVPKQGGPMPVEIQLRKGVNLEALVVDSEGRPVDGVSASYAGIDEALIEVWRQGREFPKGKFLLPGADPDRTYRVYFIAPDRHLGAFAELKYDPARKAAEVRLQPTASIRGKVVATTGEPLKDAWVSAMLPIDPKRRDYTLSNVTDEANVMYYSNMLGERHRFIHYDKHNERGEFEFDAMIPGLGYYLVGGKDASVVIESVWDLKPGEVRDLGAVKASDPPRRDH